MWIFILNLYNSRKAEEDVADLWIKSDYFSLLRNLP